MFEREYACVRARARLCRGGRWRSEVRVHGCGVWSTWGRHSACLQVSVRVVYFCVCPCLSASGCFCVSGRVSVLDRGDFSPVGSGVRASEGACRCAGRACLSAVAVVPYKPEHVCRGVCAPVRACLLGHSSVSECEGVPVCCPSALRPQATQTPKADR